MLNPQYERYEKRIQELADEGRSIASMVKPSSSGSYIQEEDRIPSESWLVKVENIIENVFGYQSPHYRQLRDLMPQGVKYVIHSHDIYPIVGLLKGALDDLKNGYLLGQELIIASEVFDSVLEQAKYLVKNEYKDPAAILARIVLEDALKRLARAEDIDDKQNASGINDELKDKGKYPQSQWRLIQSWLDNGNEAANGKFTEYSNDDVSKLIEDIEGFIAGSFRI